jgi:hypothetical protein
MSTSKPPSDLPFKIGVVSKCIGTVLAVSVAWGIAPAIAVTGIMVATFVGVKKLTEK